MGQLFGTDGVRGIANKDLTVELAYKLGRIGGYLLTKGKNRPKIVVGMDTRISGDMLEAALISGICSAGVDVLSVGVLPTPAVAHLTRKYNADAGVMISASHNPVEYNGIKFFNSEGYKLSDEIENEIESYILNGEDIPVFPTGEDVGRKKLIVDALNDYTEFLKTTLNIKFDGLKIAIDCGNGAAYMAAPILLEELGADVYVIHNDPDGTNINVECGSTKPEEVQKLVNEIGADMGFAFDGDADRLIAVDEKGQIVDGDHIMAICGEYLKNKGLLTNNTIVGTVMSNLGLDICLEERDMSLIKTKVGDRYVLEEMVKHNYKLGGEQSGHIIFLDHNTTGDGLLTALQLAAVVKENKKSLSELSGIMTSLPQVLVNAKIDNAKKNSYLEDAIIKAEIDNLEKRFHGEGRVLIRPSGTEPLVRVMIEGKDKEEIQTIAEKLAELIEERLK
ncbi:phosphoglucosamine mutase [Clostridium sp. D2Q-11]|uniref:Phosphoglucosamine mutase n=1 Tax=Anaeromonas frigoriresistens TaxID=2683708 RepID=A0A942Z8R7_9FIRM|nr:phosphoglucosamine mutase [Anaeromonas frigoriresistens]MBS4538284.1 phosphoglucosamine mutase [Anaeromonas frigoriresistens]